jgi:hypothetical protein
MNAKHTWRFFRAGGFDQVRLDSGADLEALGELDQKLWVALACPATGLEFDSRTLALIDTDKDGRIRVPEFLAAVKWACGCLKNPDDLVKGSPELPLAAINDATPEGKQLLSSARQILGNLGKSNATSIGIAETSDTATLFPQTRFNGDGIVPAESSDDEAVKAVVNDIIACLGPETDRSGKPGVNQAKVDQFFAEAQAYSAWYMKGEADRTVMPLNGGTAAAAATFAAMKIKIDDYFTRCRLAAFDPRSVNALNREEKEYVLVAAKDLSCSSPEIASFPLAQVGVGKPLPLKEGVNPAWAGMMTRFEAEVVKPFLDGKGYITEGDWAAITSRFAAYESWVSTKVGGSVEKLGIKRVRELLGGKTKDAITALIAKDKALEPEFAGITALEKLVRYHRDLYRLANNFVAFRDFYSRKEKAVFQAGTLYLDQRSCDLCLRVDDAARHAAMAGLAGAYLAYCDCVRKATNEKMQIVAAFTGGDSDNLMVGRNGIFYDRQGRDWDATIAKIVDNPISIRQAFFSPYKKLVRMIEEQIAKRAAAADTAVTAKMQTAATATVAGQPPAKPAEPPKKIDTGTLAAIGLVLTTLLSALGAIFGKIVGLPWWQIPLAILALILAISVPSMLIAYLKLRKRNLGPILDANGWAVNARAKINVPFGGALTQVATLPPGSQRDLVDPFAEKRRPWGLYITLLVLIVLGACWYFGKLDRVMPGKLKSVSVLGTNAPAYTPPAGITVTNVPVVPKE